MNDLGVFAQCAWGDVNNDGFLDLLVANWYGLTNVFYLNNGNGTFTKVSQRDPVIDGDYHVGVAFADYDNDGHLDLVVSSGGGAPSARGNRLYHNNGDGTFSRASGGGVTNHLGSFVGGVWADFDNGGFLDLFLIDDGVGSTGGRNLLWHNNGDGTFTKITFGSIVTDVGVGYGASAADYDNDGFMDLIVFNNSSGAHNFLYHNNRDGTFTRVLTNAMATDLWANGAQGGAWGDYDNDGLLDLFVTDAGGTRNRLYHNSGNGAFTNVMAGSVLVPPSGGFSIGSVWGDYDNDGYLDLFVCNGDGRNQLFHNNGNGTFTQILSGSVANDGGPNVICNSCSWADYDNDGFLDLFVTQGGNLPASNFLYHNNGNSNGWLEVKCVGTASNRSAIGAKLRVLATIGGKKFWQLREISNGGGWNATPLVAHFGLGDATNAEIVRIEWPSGIVQTLTNVAPRQILTVVERQQPGAANPPSVAGVSHSTNGVVSLSVTGDTGLLYLLEASTNLVNWTKLSVRSNATGMVAFTDPKATNYASRFYRVSVP